MANQNIPAGLVNSAVLLHTMAKWWVEVPKEHLEPLKKLISAVTPERHLDSMTTRDRTMLRRFENRDLANRLLDLPDRIRSLCGPRIDITHREALRLEMAAAVAWQLSTAVRPLNLTMTRMGTNLLDQNGRLIAYYPREQVKNSVEIEVVLPSHYASIVRDYIKFARPLLCKPGNLYLFPNRTSGHKNSVYFSRYISQFVEDEIGVAVTAHRFRHVVGYIFLQDHPGQYEIVRLLLGHKDIRTTMRFYASMDTREAHKKWDRFISQRIYREDRKK